MHQTQTFYGGIGQRLQRKYAGRHIVYQTNRNRDWQLAIIPPVGIDTIFGDYMIDFPIFIVLPEIPLDFPE